MSTHGTIERSKLAAWGGVVVVLMGVAWSIGPTHSRASEGTMGVLAHDQATPDLPATDLSGTSPSTTVLDETDHNWSTLGELVGPDSRIVILASPDGPIYTLMDADGHVLDSDTDASALRARHQNLIAPGTHLMLVDDQSEDW